LLKARIEQELFDLIARTWQALKDVMVVRSDWQLVLKPAEFSGDRCPKILTKLTSERDTRDDSLSRQGGIRKR
jgi:hypothetical protein